MANASFCNEKYFKRVKVQHNLDISYHLKKECFKRTTGCCKKVCSRLHRVVKFLI